jgi:hypothetical protein
VQVLGRIKLPSATELPTSETENEDKQIAAIADSTVPATVMCELLLKLDLYAEQVKYDILGIETHRTEHLHPSRRLEELLHRPIILVDDSARFGKDVDHLPCHYRF